MASGGGNLTALLVHQEFLLWELSIRRPDEEGVLVTGINEQSETVLGVWADLNAGDGRGSGEIAKYLVAAETQH